MRFFYLYNVDAEIFRLFPHLCKPYFLFFAHKLFLLFILELVFLIAKCNIILFNMLILQLEKLF
nr:MAG TPA: hypothetical protein [Caudoviricetes sp.]